jgi:hypothetical protein
MKAVATEIKWKTLGSGLCWWYKSIGSQHKYNKENKYTQIDANENVGLEENEEEMKYILTSRHQGVAENYKIGNRSFGPPLLSSGQSFLLQIQRSGFDSRRYEIFWELVGLERGPLSPVSIIEELLERKNSDSGLGNRYYGIRRSAVLTTRHPAILKSWH